MYTEDSFKKGDQLLMLEMNNAFNISILASGSTGNSLYLESPQKRILVDAGLSGKKITSLLAEVDRKPEDLDAILVSEGPGSYTGLRIAASGVKGLLFENDVPLYGVNTLASFAISAARNHQTSTAIHSVIDARRKHLYYQRFMFDEQLNPETEVKTIPIGQFEETVEESDIIVGTGLNRIDEKVRDKAVIFGKDYITAKSLIDFYHSGENDFVNEVKPEQFEPKYYTSNQISA